MSIQEKTSGEWFNEFCSEVNSLSIENCIGLVGTEVKVLDYNGKIDLNENINEKSDLVMVSVHRFPGEEDGIFSSLNKNTLKYKEKAINIEHGLMESHCLIKKILTYLATLSNVHQKIWERAQRKKILKASSKNANLLTKFLKLILIIVITSGY